MFRKLIERGRTTQPVAVGSLEALAPYRNLQPAELEIAAGMVDRLNLKPGLIDELLPGDCQVFLESGSVQIQTHTGYVLHVSGGTPQAAFPLPRKPAVISLFAADDCKLLAVPDSVEKAPLQHAASPLRRPQMTADESQTLEQLRAYFRKQHCELPSLPDLALKIGKAIDNDNNGNDDIARLIQLDPALTARIISVVNSAAFGGVNKIKSIQPATARLGRRKVRSLVYSCLLKSIFKINSKGLKQRMEELWQHSAYVAALAFVLGRATPGIDPEQALLAGLIHDIGSVAVIGGINRHPLLARRPEVMDYTIAALSMEAGMMTLKEWNLDGEFAEVIRHAENWYRIGSAIPDNTDVVIIAQLHALIGKRPPGTLPRIDEVPAFAKLADGELTPRSSLAILERAASDVREIQSLIAS